MRAPSAPIRPVLGAWAINLLMPLVPFCLSFRALSVQLCQSIVPSIHTSIQALLFLSQCLPVFCPFTSLSHSVSFAHLSSIPSLCPSSPLSLHPPLLWPCRSPPHPTTTSQSVPLPDTHPHTHTPSSVSCHQHPLSAPFSAHPMVCITAGSGKVGGDATTARAHRARLLAVVSCPRGGDITQGDHVSHFFGAPVGER